MGHTTRGHDPARTRARVAHPLATPVCHELLKSSARCVFVVFNELSPPSSARCAAFFRPFVRFAANFTLFPARNSRAVDQRRRDVTPLVCHFPLTYFLPLPSLVIRYVATIDLSHSDRRVDRHLWKATRRRRVATKAHNIARITHSSGTPPNVGERDRDPKSAVRFEHSRIAP